MITLFKIFREIVVCLDLETRHVISTFNIVVDAKSVIYSAMETGSNSLVVRVKTILDEYETSY